MSIFFSADTGGFYSQEIHGDGIPQGAVPISEEAYTQLLAGQATGLLIVADENRAPTLAAPPPPTEQQLLSWMRAERDRLLRESDFTQIPDSPIGEGAREAWRIYRQVLRDLPETATDLTAIEWPVPPTT